MKRCVNCGSNIKCNALRCEACQKKHRQQYKNDYDKQYYIDHKEQCDLWHKCEYQQNKEEYKIRAAKERGLGFTVLIPNPYKNTNIKWDWHHIDNKNVVALPHTIHHSAQLNKTKGLTHHSIANGWVEVLYGISIKEIMEM